MKFIPYILGLILCLPGISSRAQEAFVNTGQSYDRAVLQKVLSKWSYPDGAKALTIMVRIGSNGEVLFCDAQKSSGNYVLDMQACSAVSAASPFAPPPGNFPLEVLLNFKSANVPVDENKAGVLSSGQANITPHTVQTDNSLQSGGENYADAVMARIRPHLHVPKGFKGEAIIVVHLRVDENGNILNPDIVESTGSNASLNKATLEAITKAGTMPPPKIPGQRLILTFTLRGL